MLNPPTQVTASSYYSTLVEGFSYQKLQLHVTEIVFSLQPPAFSIWHLSPPEPSPPPLGLHWTEACPPTLDTFIILSCTYCICLHCPVVCHVLMFLYCCSTHRNKFLVMFDIILAIKYSDSDVSVTLESIQMVWFLLYTLS